MLLFFENVASIGKDGGKVEQRREVRTTTSKRIRIKILLTDKSPQRTLLFNLAIHAYKITDPEVKRNSSLKTLFDERGRQIECGDVIGQVHHQDVLLFLPLSLSQLIFYEIFRPHFLSQKRDISGVSEDRG